MIRRLARFEESHDGVSLYILGLSTCDALNLFPPTKGIAVSHFSGEIVFGPPRRYLDRDNIPTLTTVQDTVLFLNAEEKLVLFDFKAALDDSSTVSTHDDCEADFRLKSRAQAIQLLEFALRPDALAAQRAAVFAHPGRFVLIGEGDVDVFETFDQALASGRLAPV